MAITKELIEDEITIRDRGGWKALHIREATVIIEDGQELSRSFARTAYLPNDDISPASDEVKKLAEIYFDQAAKEKHKLAIEAGDMPNE